MLHNIPLEPFEPGVCRCVCWGIKLTTCICLLPRL